MVVVVVVILWFSVDGDADAVVEARIRIGWNKFRQLVPLLTNKDVSLIVRGRLYSSCVRCSMSHGSETWPVRKENVVALQRAEMSMVRWMCGTQAISLQRMKLDTSNLVWRLNVKSTGIAHVKFLKYGVHLVLCDLTILGNKC